jgi:hypothetical protein
LKIETPYGPVIVSVQSTVANHVTIFRLVVASKPHVAAHREA